MLHIMDYENTYNQILGWKLIFHSLDKSFDLTFEFIATWSIHLNFLPNTHLSSISFDLTKEETLFKYYFNKLQRIIKQSIMIRGKLYIVHCIEYRGL